MSHVIGIDVGTSGIKVGAMNKEGVLGYLEYEPYSLLYPQNGWVEIQLEETWTKVKELLIKVWTEVEKIGEVDAISLSSFCNSSVFLDSDGEPLYNGIMYLDQRSKKETAIIKEVIGEEAIFDITKNRMEPGMYTVTTHLWFKEQFPDLYRKTHKWGNLSTYLLNKLTGQFVLDWTQASFSGMYDVVEYTWSTEILERLNIEMEKLPKVVDPSAIVGDLALRETFLKSVPVIAGAADTACSTLALGVQPNELFESVGTSNVLTVCTDNPNILDERFLNRCHVVKNQWLSHGAMSFPGASIQWFYEQFLAENHPKDILDDLLNDSHIGSSGIFFLPYMKGERTPIWDPDARGVFAGIQLHSTKADMYRAILEGCSFGLRQIYEIIEEKYQLKPTIIRSIGGGSKNRGWAQIKANVLDKEIEIKKESETGVLGACIIAATSIGYFSSLENATLQIRNKTNHIVKPISEEVKEYDHLYKIFIELYPSLKNFFAIASKG